MPQHTPAKRALNRARTRAKARPRKANSSGTVKVSNAKVKKGMRNISPPIKKKN